MFPVLSKSLVNFCFQLKAFNLLQEGGGGLIVVKEIIGTSDSILIFHLITFITNPLECGTHFFNRYIVF